jgi:hypothetical protein
MSRMRSAPNDLIFDHPYNAESALKDRWGLSLGHCTHIGHSRSPFMSSCSFPARRGSAWDRHFAGASCEEAGRTGAGSWSPAGVMSKPGLLIRRLGERQRRGSDWHRKYGKEGSWDGK